MYLIDIYGLKNRDVNIVYGGQLDAYSFFETTCEKWFEEFANEILSAVSKKYYPVYRLADGELRFLFGFKINWRSRPVKSILTYIKYEIFKRPWKTSWGEKYNKDELKELKNVLQKCISEISTEGKLAVYWNENGLNAFTEYSSKMQALFSSINIMLNSKNYVPFHFVQALLVRRAKELIINKNVLFVSGIDENEFSGLERNIKSFGAGSVSLYRCSATSALTEDYAKVLPTAHPDIVFVAAGIGAAKVLSGLHHLNCPVLDIGSYIHVLSGRLTEAHDGFFIYPPNDKGN